MEFPVPAFLLLLWGAGGEVFAGELVDLAEVASGDQDGGEDVLGGVAAHAPSGTVADAVLPPAETSK